MEVWHEKAEMRRGIHQVLVLGATMGNQLLNQRVASLPDAYFSPGVPRLIWKSLADRDSLVAVLRDVLCVSVEPEEKPVMALIDALSVDGERRRHDEAIEQLRLAKLRGNFDEVLRRLADEASMKERVAAKTA